MAIGEKRATVADARFPFAHRATADRNEFAECILIADFQISRFTLIFQVLRLLTDRAGGVKFVLRAGARRSAKRDVLLQQAIWAKDYIGSDYAVWPDDCSSTDFRCGINNSSRMDMSIAHDWQPLTLVLSPFARGEAKKLRAVVWSVRAWRVTETLRPL